MPVDGRLEAIARSPAADRHVVAIDDARLFGFAFALDPAMQHWPQLVDVLTRVEELGLRSYCVDDVILGVPPALAGSLLRLHADPLICQNVLLASIGRQSSMPLGLNLTRAPDQELITGPGNPDRVGRLGSPRRRSP